MKLNQHNVSLPFCPPQHVSTNAWIQKWWDERVAWLTNNGSGTWNAFRIGEAYTVILNNHRPEGNHNINHMVIFSFTDSDTAMLFKLTFG